MRNCTFHVLCIAPMFSFFEYVNSVDCSLRFVHEIDIMEVVHTALGISFVAHCRWYIFSNLVQWPMRGVGIHILHVGSVIIFNVDI